MIRGSSKLSVNSVEEMEKVIDETINRLDEGTITIAEAREKRLEAQLVERANYHAVLTYLAKVPSSYYGT